MTRDRSMPAARRAVQEAGLAARAARGDGEAFAELARRYQGLIAQTIRDVTPGLDREDAYQEALIGLYEACRAKQPGKGPFGALATVCVRFRVSCARRAARARKHRVLTEALGLDHPATPGSSYTFADCLAARAGEDPGHVVELRDELRRLTRRDVELARRRAGRRYGDAQVAHALALVADGTTLREAAAAIGAEHTTVMRWLRDAA